MISFMNIIWLQAAPTAFLNIGWKFYLAFIIPGSIGGVAMWIWWPDTNGVPLEEIAAIFGDGDEVAVYRAEIEIGSDGVGVIGEKHGEVKHVESLEGSDAADKV
jgi:hypothetical protein